MSNVVDKRKEVGDYVFYSKYARTVHGKKESWEDAVTRVMLMHHDTLYPIAKDKKLFTELFDFAFDSYRKKKVLGAQRALQYGGEQIKKHASRLYNCSSAYCNRVDFFKELMYLLLSGCGTGYSVQKIHVNQLPIIRGVDKYNTEEFIIPDSIEGWSEAIDKLVKSYFYQLPKVEFNYSKIRPEGAFISGGFRAPGAEPLKKAIQKIQDILDGVQERNLTSFECHRIACIIADAVISGGVRRSAMISLFDVYDIEMLACKSSGDWFYKYPELCRANNSAVILPDTPKEKYEEVFKYVQNYGEPGIVFLKSQNFLVNPCLPAWAKLLTPNGLKELKDINIGDEIWSKEGWTKVVNKWSTGVKDVWKYDIDNESIYLTPNHRVVQNGVKIEVNDAELIDKCLSPLEEDYNGRNYWKIKSKSYYSTEEVFDITVDNKSHTFWYGGCDVSNCCEVGMFPQIKIDGEIKYGWSFCNLTEINGAMVKNREDFMDACKAASILGTFQAYYTDFKVLSDASKMIADRDALIGVGITGMFTNKDFFFDPEIQRIGAEIVKHWNKVTADCLGIGEAARTTVIKPSGNSSQLLGTCSGISPFKFRKYIRNIQASVNEQAVREVKNINPEMVTDSFYNPGKEYVVSFPVTIEDSSICMEDLTTYEFLEFIRLTQLNWIDRGTNFNHPSYQENPELRMNVSNTVTVKNNEWGMVRDYLWEHKGDFCGVSFISETGDLDYPQAPYTSFLDEKELVEKYGSGAILSSGLIVDGLNLFKTIWIATDTALGFRKELLECTNEYITKYIGEHITEGKFRTVINGVLVSDVNAVIDYLKNRTEARIDWVRRFNKFARNYFNNDKVLCSQCLKHVDIFHRWHKIKNCKSVDWEEVDWEQSIQDAGSDIGTACSGGKCEL